MGRLSPDVPPTIWRSMPASRRLLAALEAFVLVVTIILVDMGISGHFVFANAGWTNSSGPTRSSSLAASTTVARTMDCSWPGRAGPRPWCCPIPTGTGTPVMRRVCREPDDVEVICFKPDPGTTRGEAQEMRRLADQRSWSKIIVVSWRYHLPPSAAGVSAMFLRPCRRRRHGRRPPPLSLFAARVGVRLRLSVGGWSRQSGNTRRM